VCHGILLSHKEKWNYIICRKMDGTEVIMLNEISQAQKARYHSSHSVMESRPKMMMVMVHECERGMVLGINQRGEGERTGY
jgi:hypothetical protein